MTGMQRMEWLVLFSHFSLLQQSHIFLALNTSNIVQRSMEMLIHPMTVSSSHAEGAPDSTASLRIHNKSIESFGQFRGIGRHYFFQTQAVSVRLYFFVVSVFKLRSTDERSQMRGRRPPDGESLGEVLVRCF